MEIAGLIFGTVTLSSLLNTCFDIYNKIEGLKEAAGDLADVRSRLDLEVRKLRYIEKKSASGTLDKDAEEVMILAQQQVNDRLMKIQSIVFKYCHEEPGISSLLRPKEQRFSRSPGRRLKWITSDKNYMEEQLLRLQHLIETLWKLATSEPERVREDYISRTDTIATRDASFLTTVAAMSAQQYPGLVKAARVKQRLSQCIGVTSALPASDATGGNSKFHITVTSIQWQARDLRAAMREPWALGNCPTSGAGVSEVPVVVQWRGPFMGRSSPALMEKRLDTLCEFLRAMHTVDHESDFSHLDQYARNADFGMLKCLGWTTASDSFDSIALIFQCPHKEDRQPESLWSKILKMRAQRKVPPLGDRFDLAFGICNAVANIISIGWMHRAIRSDNMLVFDQRSIRKIYLVGFTYTRPGVAHKDDASKEISNLPDTRGAALYRPSLTLDTKGNFSDSTDEEDNNTALSHHMSRLSLSPGSAAHDLYGLGIVLLEIGLWDTIENMKQRRKDLSIQDFQARGLKEPLTQLSSRCGDIYRDVVERCLSPAEWQGETLMKNLGDILGSLKQCRA